jgi:hypothetical protein
MNNEDKKEEGSDDKTLNDVISGNVFLLLYYRGIVCNEGDSFSVSLCTISSIIELHLVANSGNTQGEFRAHSGEYSGHIQGKF